MMMMDAGDPLVDGPAPPGSTAIPANAAATSEALSALSNLGYAPADAARAVAEAADGASDTGQLIRAALRLLAPKE